jgi:hypothetical protein
MTIVRYVSTHQIEKKDLCSLLLNYNALVLSFSLASLALIIAIPSQEFTIFISKIRSKKHQLINPFKNLILAFFQCAFSHYISLCLVFLILIFAPEKISIRQLFDTQYWINLALLIQIWAFIVFGLALRDITALGILYSSFLMQRTQSSN